MTIPKELWCNHGVTSPNHQPNQVIRKEEMNLLNPCALNKFKEYYESIGWSASVQKVNITQRDKAIFSWPQFCKYSGGWNHEIKPKGSKAGGLMTDFCDGHFTKKILSCTPLAKIFLFQEKSIKNLFFLKFLVRFFEWMKWRGNDPRTHESRMKPFLS